MRCTPLLASVLLGVGLALPVLAQVAPEYGDLKVPSHWLAEAPAGDTGAPVTEELLLGAAQNRGAWLHYHGDYRGFRHSPVRGLTPQNAKRLRPLWALPTGAAGHLAVSPIFFDGILYVTTPRNRLYAVDARSGEVLWRYDHQQPDDLRVCCGYPNRGVAISGGLVFMATLDAKLLAFDRATGERVWETTLADYQKGLSATAAPLVVGDLVMIGIAGGEYGVRGFFDAYRAATGERVWRHYTVPVAGEPGAETWGNESYKSGGAAAWTTGSYDPDTDTLFWTTGNPSPDWNGDGRPGDNLFSDSVLAVDPKTGKRKWYFQFTPHDVWDYDGNTQLFLIEVSFEGKPVKALAQPNRNGFFYLLDRSTGKFLRATPYVEQLNWAASIDTAGRPQVDPAKMPSETPSERICPGAQGGLNGGWTASYSPQTGLAYVPSLEACQYMAKGMAIWAEGAPYLGGSFEPVDANAAKSYGRLVAYDPATGEVRWAYRDPHPLMGGTVTTAGGLVVTGNQAGFALGFDAETGEEVWRYRLGAPVRSQPIAFELDGVPHLAIGAGQDPLYAAVSGGPTRVPEGGVLYLFRLE